MNTLRSIRFTHKQVTTYMVCLLIVGLLHHSDHVLRYDHSGWPFTPAINAFTFSLIVYPAIISLFIVRQRLYKIIVACMLVIALLSLHIFLETPQNQYHTWAHNSSDSQETLGHHNLLNIESPLMGVVSTTLSMTLNIGAVLLPFVFWREEDFKPKRIK